MRRIIPTNAHIDALKPAMWGNSKKTIKREIESGVLGVYQSSDNKMLYAIRFEYSQMVVVLAVGKDLIETRHELIELAKANNCHSIRFHTNAPEHLAKATQGLIIHLLEKRKRFFSPDEYIYITEV